MRNQLVSLAVAGVLALAMAPQAQAQTDDLAALKAQLEALQQKVQDLEKQQKAQQDSQDRTTDLVAQAKSATPEWLNRFTWKGDLRYRHEYINAEEAPSDQTRHRIRARFGFTAKVNDTVTATMQLSTIGTGNDPRSRNQTLGEGWNTKTMALELAYIDWKPLSGLNTLDLMFGKMSMPTVKTPSSFFDPDLVPEGIALKFARGPFFASAFNYWLSERSAASDATLTGAQAGMTGALGGVKLTGAVAYYDVGAVQGMQTAQPAGGACASPFNTAFFGGAQGNTTTTIGGCPFLVNDYNMVEGLLQAEMKVGSQPLTLFADYIRNREADDLDSAVAVGATLGKASNPRTWEVSYIYQQIEKDAQFAQFVDSDFGGGVTDVDGSIFKVGYAVAKNWVLSGTYFLNNRFIDAPGATQRDYKRYQLDLNFKF